MTKLVFHLCAAGVLIALGGCTDDSRTRLFEAQICIDKIQVTSESTKAELDPAVDACMEKIAGQTTRESYILRCSGDFIRQGFAETAIYQAVESLDEEKKDDSTDPTGEVMTLLAFDTIPEVTSAVTNCRRSESEALRDLSDLANMATILKSIAGDSQSIEELIENFDPNTSMTDEQKLSLAEAVIESQDSLCKAGSGTAKDSETCENINGAIAANGTTTDAEKIALINQFMANSGSGED